MLKITITYLMLILGLNLFANVPNNDTCKGCHPAIYKEFSSSVHKKSTIFEDPIHKAIWDKHPLKKKGKYGCAKCHTPGDKRIAQALKDGNEAIPRLDNAQKQGISCITCHSIKSIESHPQTSDKNILIDNNKSRPTLFAINKDKRGTTVKYESKSTFMGMFKSTTGSPYHDINYSNDNFYTGKICMGCHGHKENKHGQNICTTDSIGAVSEKENCITCHMPKVKGSATSIVISKKHTFHGFAGAHNNPKMLAKYLIIEFKKTTDGFEIILTNNAMHNLLLHPLRLAKLDVMVNDGKNITKLKSKSFMRVLGHDGKPAMPWIATEIYKDNMLKAGERRVIKYNTKVQTGNKVEVKFGYYLVNPKIVNKLNLDNNKKLTEYKSLKVQKFEVK